MKKRILLLAALVSISALSATTTEAAYGTEISSWSGLETNKDAENIEFSGDITAEGGSPYGPSPAPITFKSAANQTINGKYHSFSSNDVYNESESKWLYYSLDISKTGGSLSLKNLGQSSDGDASSNTFSYVDLDGNTVYKNINASVNNWKGYFLTIKTPITVNIENSVFANNGKDSDARLIYVDSAPGGTLNVKDSIFYNNTMANAGPVINGDKFNINVENSIFYGNKQVRNTSAVEGGAIYSANGTVTVKNSYFINNDVKNIAFPEDNTFGKGGAIYIKEGSGHTIENSRFEGNTSVEEGGAVYTAYKANVDYVKNSQFIGNKQTSTHSGTSTMYGGGGGLSIGGGYIRTIDNVLFDSNSSANKGGGLYIEEISISPSVKKVVLVKDSTFENNDALLGGGMYFSADYGNNAKHSVRIVDSDFTSNTATQGGGLYLLNADASIISAQKDVIFSGNTASGGGDDIYFKTKSYAASLFLNAAEDKKIVFNGTIATTQTKPANVPVININKGEVTYSTYEGETETVHNAGTTGEIQFNNQVGDADGNISNINLYGGKLSIGQNSTINASVANPDGFINDNNFSVLGDSTLSTVNGVIGNFAPKAFSIASDKTLDYMFDVDLVGGVSDTLAITDLGGSLELSSFNVISDTDADGLKIKYSDTNVEGVVKDGYSITTSVNSYDVTAENDGTGSYVVFTKTSAGGGLANAIANESDQYIITSGEDENVTGWSGSDGNVIKSDIDINGNGHSIYTENGLDGMVVSDGTDVTLRNVEDLSGFNNALTNDGGTLSIIDSNITGNSGEADITNNGGSVIINADTKDINIGSENTDNALLSDGGTIDVQGSNTVTFNGDVAGDNDAQMNISTDTTFNGNVLGMNVNQSEGTIEINGELSDADYTLDDGTLNVKESGSFSPDNFEMNNGTVNIDNELVFAPVANIFNGGNINAANDNIGSLNFNDLTLNGTINLAVDVDLYTEIMDTISASTLQGNGKIKVNQFNLLSDTNKPKVSINFADANLKDYVFTDVKTVEGKIFKYDVGYDSKTGQFTFVGGGKPEGYSPSVMASPVAAQLQGYLTQLNSYDEAFRNMDMYMLLPKKVRQAMKYRNRVAINSSDYVYDSDKTIYDNSTGWLRTHTTFENVPLKNGPKVNNIAYGIYFGGESELYDLGKGWEGMWGLYAGYNGSHQSYSGISMYQNGGTLGLLGMVYKGNFFQGLTINTGANGGEASTRYGNEDFAMLMAGVASKTGYNIELKEGKFIVQPSLLLSYSFVNTFDYTNAAGIKISSDPLHAIQVEPNIKFIANLKNGWQPYASVGMVWNIMDKTHYKANDVSLPELSVKPYVKYGVGIRKSWGERFTGFFQTFITNGGRNGVGLQLGFRWSLGNRKPKTKVLHDSSTVSNKKVIKKS